MQINRTQLNRRVTDFLRSPDAGPIFDAFDMPLLARLIRTAVLLAIALFALCTVVLIPIGIRAIGYVLRGNTLSNPWGRLRRDPEQLQPLIACGIMMGPQGRSLVLGTFDEQADRNFDLLASKSREFGRIYSAGAANPDETEIAKLLQDDAYQPNRRRRVIEPHAEDFPLYLFDMHIKAEEAQRGQGDRVLIACVATPGETGVIQQIPWRVVDDAVKV